MRNVVYITFFCLHLGAAAPSIAVAAPVQLQEFQIDIPDDWMPVPSDQIKRINDNSVKRSGKSKNYEYGFQHKDTRGWFDYPYILIRRNTDGRWTEQQVLDEDKDFAAAQQKYTTRLKQMISRTSSDKAVFDPYHLIVWKNLDLTLAGVGQVQGLSGTKLTSSGYVQVIAYDRATSFNQNASLFIGIIQSVRLAPSLHFLSGKGSAQQGAAAPKKRFSLINVLSLLMVIFLGIGILKLYKKSR